MRLPSLLLSGLFCLAFISSCKKDDNSPSGGNPVNATGMTITKITVTDFPATAEGGGGWDLVSGPDLIVKMAVGNTCGDTYMTPTFFENATPGDNQEWELFWEITDVNTNWSVCAFDYDDLDADDPMGGISFKPQDYFNGSSTSVITLNASGVAMKLNVTWDY